MGAPLGRERGDAGEFPKAGFLSSGQRGSLGAPGAPGGRGREGTPGHGCPGAGIPLPGSPGAGAGPGAPLTLPLGCSPLRAVPHGRGPPTRAAAMGNTTSDRVAGERHGAKSARAEGAGGHAPGKEHKIMVGSTDDPSVFSLPDSKVSVPTPSVGGDAVAAWVSGLLILRRLTWVTVF